MTRHASPDARAERDRKILALYLEGWEVQSIAERFGVPETWIARTAARHGWPSRPKALCLWPEWRAVCRQLVKPGDAA